jgi:hypothetical protein
MCAMQVQEYCKSAKKKVRQHTAVAAVCITAWQLPIQHVQLSRISTG